MLLLAVVFLGAGCPNTPPSPEFTVGRYSESGNYLGTYALTDMGVVDDPQVVLYPPEGQIILTAKNFCLQKAFGEFYVYVSEEFPNVPVPVQLFGPRSAASESEKSFSHEQLVALGLLTAAHGIGQVIDGWYDLVQADDEEAKVKISFKKDFVRMAVIRLEPKSGSDFVTTFSNPLSFGGEGEGEGESDCGAGAPRITVTSKPDVASYDPTVNDPATYLLSADVAGMIGVNMATASYVIGADGLVYGPKDQQSILDCAVELVVCNNIHDADQVGTIIVIYDKTKTPMAASGISSLPLLDGEVVRQTVSYSTGKVGITIDSAPSVSDAVGAVAGSVVGNVPAGSMVAVKTLINGVWKPFPPLVEVNGGKWIADIYQDAGDERYVWIQADLMAPGAEFPGAAKSGDILATTVYKRVPSICITDVPEIAGGNLSGFAIMQSSEFYRAVVWEQNIAGKWAIVGGITRAFSGDEYSAPIANPDRVTKYWVDLVSYPLQGDLPQGEFSGERPPEIMGTVAYNWVKVSDLVDTTPPVITLLGEPTVLVEVNTTWTDLDGVTAVDDVDGILTSSVVATDEPTLNLSQLGTYVRHYNVADSAGNQATEVIRTIVVVDTTYPAIDLPIASPQVWEAGTAYTAPESVVTDNYDVGLVADVAVDVDPYQVGLGTVTYTVADSSGNETVRVLEVNVVDTTPPVIAPLGNVNMRQWDSTTIQLSGSDNVATGLNWVEVASSNGLLQFDWDDTGALQLYTHDAIGISTVVVALVDGVGLETRSSFQVTVCECTGPIIEVLQTPAFGTWDTLKLKVSCYNPENFVIFTQVSVTADENAMLPAMAAGPWWPKDNWGLAGFKSVDPMTKTVEIMVATGGRDDMANGIDIQVVQSVVDGQPLTVADLPPGNALQQPYVGLEPFVVRGGLAGLYIDRTPRIIPTYVSPYGDADGRVEFVVTGIDPSLFDIVADVWADGLAGEPWGFGWRTKPSFEAPITMLNADSSGLVDYTTGPGDTSATTVALTLRWKSDVFPPLYGQEGVDGSDLAGPAIPGALVQRLVALNLDGTADPAYILTMVVSGQGTVEPGIGDHYYPVVPTGGIGVNAVLRATPMPGWHFARWEGSTASETAASTITVVNCDQTIRAVFEQDVAP
ncbi:MAG: immunoglobulin-like domain-containing protein [Candidatus Buchananbacteria bacterium]